MRIAVDIKNGVRVRRTKRCVEKKSVYFTGCWIGGEREAIIDVTPGVCRE